MKLTPPLLALLVAPLAPLAQAEVTFTPFATYQWFDTGTVEALNGGGLQPDISDHEGYALSLGYRFTPALGLEAHYGRTETQTEVDPVLGNLAADVRHNRLSLDGYYAFNAERRYSPYVLLGVGQTHLKTPAADTYKDTLVNAGVGAFWRFNENVALRWEVRNVHNVDASLDDQVALIGIEFSPGAAARTAEPAPSPVAPEPAAAETAAAPAAVVVEAPVDSDADGVPDAQDRCAATPAGVKVDASGCPLDSDGDGVADYQDKCPDTKAGAAVDGAGCYEVLKQEVAIALNVQFGSGKAEIQGDASAEIQKVADFMKKYPTVNVTIEGHTDNRGNPARNKALSLQRAEAVKAALVKLGVDPARLTAVGYGAEKPIADNATEAGRAQNRRVVASAKAETETIKMKR